MTERNWHKHALARNEANRRPSMFVFVHCETETENVKDVHPYIRHQLHKGTAVAVEWRKGRRLREKRFDFTDAALFWAWLPEWQRKSRVLWVVMHDGLRICSLLNTWERIDSGEYRTEKPGYEYKDRRTGKMRQSEPWKGLVAIEGRPFHLELDGPKGRVNFTDIRNYYPGPLEELPFTGTPIEVIKQAYLNLLMRWEREKNGNWQFSASGLAGSMYRHKFMRDKIIMHNHAEALELERAACYGGECRCWYRGRVDRPLIEYDMNSSYGFGMVDKVFPTALIDHWKGDCYDRLGAYIDQYAAVAEVTLKTDIDHYPYKRGGQTIYPVGKFRTVLCGPELLRAYDNGHIRSVHSLSLYTVANIFTPYVLHWWEDKKRCERKGDKAGRSFAKMMINCLPARFNQQTPVWVDNDKIDVNRQWKYFPWRDPKTGTIYPARSFGWRGQFMAKRKPTENAFPLIFAYVTAYVRDYMRQIRKDIAPSCLLYQDTDSFICDDPSYYGGEDYGVPLGEGLGQFKVKGHYQSADFRGPKNYTVDDRLVIAGVKADDYHHSDTEHTGLRCEKTPALFTRPHDGSVRELVVDLTTNGNAVAQRYGPDGWALPMGP